MCVRAQAIAFAQFDFKLSVQVVLMISLTEEPPHMGY